jgi:hypothetical protein
MKRALAIAFAIVIVFAAANIHDPVAAQSDKIQIFRDQRSEFRGRQIRPATIK